MMDAEAIAMDAPDRLEEQYPEQEPTKSMFQKHLMIWGTITIRRNIWIWY